MHIADAVYQIVSVVTKREHGAAIVEEQAKAVKEIELDRDRVEN